MLFKISAVIEGETKIIFVSSEVVIQIANISKKRGISGAVLHEEIIRHLLDSGLELTGGNVFKYLKKFENEDDIIGFA